MKIEDVRTDFDNFTHKFMPDGHGNFYGLLGPTIPIKNMNIGAANSGAQHTNQHIVDAD